MMVGILGKKGHGKDSVGDILVRHWGFCRVAFADVLKRECEEIYGIDWRIATGSVEEKEAVLVEHGVSARHLWQRHGDMRSKAEPGYFVTKLAAEVERLREDGVRHFVITDVRHHDEVEYIAGQEGTTWRVMKDEEHSSETALDGYTASFDIDNDGSLDELHEAVMAIMTEAHRGGCLSR